MSAVLNREVMEHCAGCSLSTLGRLALIAIADEADAASRRAAIRPAELAQRLGIRLHDLPRLLDYMARHGHDVRTSEATPGGEVYQLPYVPRGACH